MNLEQLVREYPYLEGYFKNPYHTSAFIQKGISGIREDIILPSARKRFLQCEPLQTQIDLAKVQEEDRAPAAILIACIFPMAGSEIIEFCKMVSGEEQPHLDEPIKSLIGNRQLARVYGLTHVYREKGKPTDFSVTEFTTGYLTTLLGFKRLNELIPVLPVP